MGLKNTFITHLKMKGLWDEYELKESFFSIEFNAPSQFYELREQQITELKFANFGTMSQHPKISDSIAQKKYLKWSDKQVAENREWLRKDAAFTFELAQIEAMGPNWREQMQAQGDALAGGGEPGGGMGMPGPAGSALPPFGGPADTPGAPGDTPVEPTAVSDTETSLPDTP
jgi:hypothetical protein